MSGRANNCLWLMCCRKRRRLPHLACSAQPQVSLNLRDSRLDDGLGILPSQMLRPAICSHQEVDGKGNSARMHSLRSQGFGVGKPCGDRLDHVHSEHLTPTAALEVTVGKLTVQPRTYRKRR